MSKLLVTKQEKDNLKDLVEYIPEDMDTYTTKILLAYYRGIREGEK